MDTLLRNQPWFDDYKLSNYDDKVITWLAERFTYAIMAARGNLAKTTIITAEQRLSYAVLLANSFRITPLEGWDPDLTSTLSWEQIVKTFSEVTNALSFTHLEALRLVNSISRA